jgi:hypothetical protein
LGKFLRFSPKNFKEKQPILTKRSETKKSNEKLNISLEIRLKDETDEGFKNETADDLDSQNSQNLPHIPYLFSNFIFLINCYFDFI